MRTACDLALDTVDAFPDSTALEEALEPGDIVVCRNADHWMSQIITNLDGYWSHSALYVGQGEILHAASGGVAYDRLDTFAARYPAGVGVARPDRPVEDRRGAAEWARALVATSPDGSDEPVTRYSGRDLGIAFALLLRARASGARRLEPLDAVEEGLESMLRPGGFSSTCSGFVYQAYAEGLQDPLEIVPAPGLRVEDGEFYFPDGDDLYRSLIEDSPHEGGELGEPELEGLGLPTIWAWRNKAALFGGLAVGWATTMVPTNRRVPIEKGVSPADLWCSPEIANRWYLSPDHATLAYEAVADCP